MTSAKPLAPPVGVFVVAVVALLAAIFLTVSVVNNFDTAEIRPRAIFFPLLLWAVGIAAVALGVMQAGARRRYLAATTPQQRIDLEAAAKSGSSAKRRGPRDN